MRLILGHLVLLINKMFYITVQKIPNSSINDLCVAAGLMRSGTIQYNWSIFVEDGLGNAVTIDSQETVEMLKNVLKPELRLQNIKMTILLFQQNEATGHTARASVVRLQWIVPAAVISWNWDLNRYGLPSLSSMNNHHTVVWRARNNWIENKQFRNWKNIFTMKFMRFLWIFYE